MIGMCVCSEACSVCSHHNAGALLVFLSSLRKTMTQHARLPGLLHLVDLLSVPSTQVPDFHLQVVHTPSRMFTGAISTLQSTNPYRQPLSRGSTGYPPG